MLKVYIIMIVYFLIFFLSSCSIKIVTLKEKELIIQKDSYSYPSFNEEIDNYIIKEIKDTLILLKDFATNIKFSYQYEINDSILNYKFNFFFLVNKQEEHIIKCYNFDAYNNLLLEVDDNYLYNELDNINKALNSNLIINENEFSLLEYIIKRDKCYLYIPKVISKKKVYEVVLNNVSIISKEIKKEENKDKNFQKQIAITFDDAPSSKTKILVDLLDELNVKATFFILGENVNYYQDNLKYIVNKSHEIGSHSYTHPQFDKLTISDILLEVKRTDDLIYEVVRKPPRIFRFPYGIYTEEILKYIKMPCIFWSSDSCDWRIFETDEIVNEVLKDVKDKGIILFHDASYLKIDAIKEVIILLKQDGYQFVRISELLGLDSQEKYYNYQLTY